MPDPLPWDQFENHHVLNRHSATPVHIVGAGLAGCWMARTLAEAGIKVVVLEAGSSPASAASSNPAGIVKPFISRSPSLAMSFYLEAHRYLLKQLAAWGLREQCEFSPCGVVQLVDEPFPPSEHYQNLPTGKTAEALGVACDSQALLFEQSGWLNPAALCSALLNHPLIGFHSHYRVHSIEPLHNEDGWQVSRLNQPPLQVQYLVLSTGVFLNHFVQSQTLSITPARGQLNRYTLKPGSAALKRIVNGKHYLIPDGKTVIVGATFERDVNDDSVRESDNRQNLHGLKKTLSALSVNPDTVEGFAGVRATTPDRLPLVGPLPDPERTQQVYADLHHGRHLHDYPSLPVQPRAYVLGGLGSRGIVTAPFAAHLLTDFMLGGHDITLWSSIINPARFQIRALKRKQN